MVFLLCFLLFSGTTLFAQNTYPAAPDLFGGPMGIERVPHTGFPVHAHHPVYTSEVNL
jgi:hypothetical protein